MELCHLPAHELVRLMTSRSVSCREVTQAHLAQIERVNPTLNALVEAADPEECLRLADHADECAARGRPLGAAHGLPVVVKDVIKVAGLACSGGSSALRAVAPADATAVARLRGAGAIVLGLTNVPELGRGAESNNSLYGRTNNPYDLARTPGGSSGGSAALVAAGGAALSVGTDEGGSIRQPSHNTGIAGLKPSHGRIPRTGNVFGSAPGIFGPFSHYGPLARSVADLFLGLSIMQGPDLRDPYAVPAPLGNPADVDLASLRVATYLDDGISAPTDEVAAVVTAAAAAVGEVAAHVRHAIPGCLGRTMELLWTSVFLGGDGGQEFEEVLRALGVTETSEELAEFRAQASKVEFSVTHARRRLAELDQYRVDMLKFMADYDVIVCPAMPTPAKPHHHGLVEVSDFSHLMVHNITRWPAAVVRCGTSNDGLPIGVQIVARPWQDATALAVAAHLETVFGGWQPPPLWV
ncbi:amidase [Mycobacterium conspicuum]|uniref:Amidase n=1 Tax=Mycobacterium conspicuum TaxID=44010 RepID=A0A1X1T260_9MYCO|nr:amidase [Mycobacterium conspicuum]ORV38374.1 amidase [Mycobacterium conspicuum]BBZ39679.1 amidase [Mycobacterium conspicuum]